MSAIRTASDSLRNAFAAFFTFSISLSFAPLLVNAQDEPDQLQPYTVYVDQEQVMARCGPGGDYYRTDELRHGQALEVYVETEDNWLGIRPPDGSFSWLPADAVKLSPSQGFATVKEDHTIAWIGTHLGQASKYLWQVELAKGEEVAIIGRAKREGPDGVKVWYRIVPPAGEFRWVHRDQVVDSPELLLRDKPTQPRLAAKSGTAVRPATFSANRSEAAADNEEELNETNPSLRDDQGDSEPAQLRPLPRPEPDAVPLNPLIPDRTSMREQGIRSAQPAAAPEQPIGSGVVPVSAQQPSSAHQASSDQQLRRSIVDGTDAYPGSAPIARQRLEPEVGFSSSPRIVQIGETQPPAMTPVSELTDSFGSRNAPRHSANHQDTRVVPATIASRANPAAAVAPQASLNSFNEVQFELSRLMARSASAGEVQTVIHAARQLSQAATTEADRQAWQTIIERATRYQQVAQRRTGQASPTDIGQASYPAPVLSDAAQVDALQPDALPMSQPVEDAVSGYLVQVFSARPDSPPFALTDSQGRTTHYVSAAPGVNLRRYLNQHVTVRGTAGYSTGLDTPHVIAGSAIRSLEPAQ